MANELKAEYLTDKFHAIKLLWNTFVTKDKRYLVNWDGYYKSTEYFNRGDYDRLIETLIEYNVKKEIINYFKRAKFGVINQSKEWNLGCSAESDVYHFVKSSCSGARIFSYNHFLNMLELKAYSYNQL